MSSSKSRSHHKSSSKHSSKSASGKANRPSDGVLSFYFVVNELVMKSEYVERDHWDNSTPPSTPHGFEDETPGIVFRYRDGDVHPATNMTWVREWGWGHEGKILDSSRGWLTGYCTGTFFDCGPFLPTICAHGDPTVNSTSGTHYSALHFSHEEGVSRATNGQYKYVAGRNASWVGSLVPINYESRIEQPPRSQGLGGQIEIILGLMALTQRKWHASDAFRHWIRRKWNGRRHPVTTPDGPPRGVLVHVALDPAQDPAQCESNLQAFEQYGIAVMES